MSDLHKYAMTFKLPQKLFDPAKDDKLKKVLCYPFIEIEEHSRGAKIKCNRLKQFFRELQDVERVHIAYTGIYSETNSNSSPHIHAALLYEGDEGLSQKSIERWESRWNVLSGFKTGGLIIRPMWDEDGWKAYLLKHKDRNSMMFWHNGKLLQKHNLYR